MPMGSYRGKCSKRVRACSRKWEELARVELTKKSDTEKQPAYSGKVVFKDESHNERKVLLYYNKHSYSSKAPVLVGTLYGKEDTMFPVELWRERPGSRHDWFGKVGKHLRMRLNERNNVVTGSVIGRT